MPSFDIVSEVDVQEIENAVNQARKEISNRYDFRGHFSVVEWDKKEIRLLSEDEVKLSAMKDVLQSKLHRRGLDIRAFDFSKKEEMGGQKIRNRVVICQGIDKEAAKKLVKSIKNSKIKVQAAIQDDRLRVTSKSIDALQDCITYLKGQDLDLPLQFENMRS